jgi:nitrate reductase NapE component
MGKLSLINVVKSSIKHSRVKMFLFILLFFLSMFGVALVAAAIYSYMNVQGSVTIQP